MSELRFDPIRRRWSIIATERRFRPHEFKRPVMEPPGDVGGCPFEYGNEHTTPPEVFAIPRGPRLPNTPNWSVRVVPNKFPALGIEGELSREAVGIFDKVAGIGAHEVIVETPDHLRPMADLTPPEISLVFRAWRDRIVDLRRDTRIRYVLLFKNHGREAGASLYHPHSQLIATPIIPTVVVQELNVAREHWGHKERCVFCDLIAQERAFGDRMAIETERFVALEPFASAFPFETWILPKRHGHDFALCPDDLLEDLARLLHDFLRRIRALLDDPPYNLILHTAPSPHPRPGQPEFWSTIEYDFHWHIEFIPRITRIAGFEWGSGYSINPTPPEEAARFLRDVIVEPS
ncbi:MAG: galactose-1-phosphate uridylyltransferase [Acidobacteria bacterium]|nr:galactose-1-phosphate uridylyltransferase [Acidobacteriota bacterium]